MKYTKTISFLIFIVTIGCKSEKTTEKFNNESKQVNETKISKSTNTTTELKSKGAILMKNSDCFTCHSKDEKIIGPSFKQVALKYDNNNENINELSNKIIKGGSGVWGEIPMQSHSEITMEDANEMARTILSFK